MDLISILMPTYNVLPYIDEAINSILIQTYDNWELIIVDDCSTDGTYEHILELCKGDSRITVYRNDENSKICKTLNRAISYAKGDYIARMDGDDISTPNRLKVLKGYLDRHSSCTLVGSSSIGISEDGETLSYRQAINTWRFIKRYMKYNSCIQHIWLARREIYDCLGGYREIPYAEDYDFLFRGIQKGFKYANVNDYLYKVRIRYGNTASTNGLYQQKARKLVQELYKREKKSNCELLTKELIEARMLSTDKELASFEKANRHLVSALHSRGSTVKMVREASMAVLGSRYIADLLYGAVQLRIGKLIESQIIDINGL